MSSEYVLKFLFVSNFPARKERYMRASENMRLGRELWQAARVVAAALLFAAAALRGYRVYIARGQTMHLSSTDFKDGSQIPAKFTCSGEGFSPQLTWSAPPAKTASLALIFK